MKIILSVPFKDKYLVKSLGAKWDSEKQYWYIENHPKPDLFFDWVRRSDYYLWQPTKSNILKHPAFKVTQPRTPRKVNNKRGKRFK